MERWLEMSWGDKQEPGCTSLESDFNLMRDREPSEGIY